MYVSKDSMWQGMLQNFAKFFATKQGLEEKMVKLEREWLAAQARQSTGTLTQADPVWLLAKQACLAI
jgi:hypothetical protein